MNVFLATLLVMLASCITYAQNAGATIIRNPEAFTPIYVNENISSTLKDGSTVSTAPITLHMNEKLHLRVQFLSEPDDFYFDKKFTLSNADDIDQSILSYGGEDLNNFWFPQHTGDVSFEFEVAWHDKGLSPRGVPIIIDRNGPPKSETIKVTVHVEEAVQ